MLRVALCDDNSEYVQEYAKIIAEIANKHNIELELSCFYSGESLLFHYEDIVGHTDIIFLDIIMNKTDGMETARKLRESGCNAQIVFLTSYEDYVYDAFEVKAVQYLLKSTTNVEKFEKVFLRTVALVAEKEQELFSFEYDGKTSFLPLAQITHFEIWKRVVTVYYGTGNSARFYASMDQLESHLAAKNFARSHRSYLVNLSFIMMFSQNSLLLKDNTVIPIGVTYANSLKRAFSDYMSHFNVFDFKAISAHEHA